MRTTTKAFLALPAALALSLTTAPGAFAAQGNNSYQIDLTDTMNNESGSQATADVRINGDRMTVSIEGTGFTPESPHAQHFHGSFDAAKDFTCPTSDADENGDGQVDTAEGLPAYGDIVISLTTEGDTSPDSGLAVDRMPVADADGNLTYERTFDLPAGAGDALRNLHIVQHGLDANGNDMYDAEALGESEFAKSLGVEGIPEEATNPATCGTISGASAGAAPTGGVETGAGSTEGPESLAMFALGGVALAGVGGALAYRRRIQPATAG